MASATNTAPLSTGKRRLFTALMVLIPVVFFVLLEGGLRLAGYGDDYPLFVEVPGYPDYRYPSRDVARRYFARFEAPSIPFDAFRVTKAEGTFRVFVQGGSSAAGYPFYYGGSFPDMLEQRLLQTMPGRNVEVVNTAMAAVNSYTLLDLADDIIAQEPDAVLIYAGHNEYYGALGVASAESIGQFRGLVNLYLQLRYFRTVQALRALLSKLAGLLSQREAGASPSGTLMERMVANQSIAYGSQTFEHGLRQFRGNLADLLARYEAHGIPVYVATLVSNERHQPPFVNGLAETTDEAAWQGLFREGVEDAARGDTAAALTAFDEAIRLDSLGANAFYAKARLLDATGRTDEARAAYLAAKDRDQLPFRAPEAINRIIREEAARHGAVLVDAHAALAAASPGGIVGREFILEHLHPNIDGYFGIADAFYQALMQNGALGSVRPVPADLARREVLITAVDSLSGVFRVRKLMAGWPFQPPGVVDARLATITPQTPLEQIALAYYEGSLTWREAIEQMRQEYESQGDYHHALQAALAVIQRYSFLPGPYLSAADILTRQGRYAEALVYYEASNDREESSAAQRMLGSILLQQGQRDEAIAHLERAVHLDPANQQALYNLSGAYALKGRIADARTTARRLLEVNPQHADGQRLLASLPASTDAVRE